MSIKPKTTIGGTVTVLHAGTAKPTIPDDVLRDLAVQDMSAAIEQMSTTERRFLLEAIPPLCLELLRRRVAMRTGII